MLQKMQDSVPSLNSGITFILESLYTDCLQKLTYLQPPPFSKVNTTSDKFSSKQFHINSHVKQSTRHEYVSKIAPTLHHLEKPRKHYTEKQAQYGEELSLIEN